MRMGMQAAAKNKITAVILALVIVWAAVDGLAYQFAHTAVALDALYQALDSDRDGQITDEAWYITFNSKQDELAEGPFVAGDKTKLDGLLDWQVDQTPASIHSGNIPDLSAIYWPITIDLWTEAENTAAGYLDQAAADLIYEPIQTAASQAEAEAGTEVALRSWSPLRVAQAIAALASGTGDMTNPMTTAGDIIYGGVDGAPTRLAKGANNSVFGVNGSGTLGYYTSFASDDSDYQFYDSADTTKQAQFELGSITTGNKRVYTLPDYAMTLASLPSAPVIDDPDNFAANFTGKNLYGGTFIANAAGTAALPDPAVGMHFTIVLEGANAVVVDPLDTGTADTIYMNGTAAASDENITSSTSGAMCVFQYRAANTWMATCNDFAEATP